MARPVHVGAAIDAARSRIQNHPRVTAAELANITEARLAYEQLVASALAILRAVNFGPVSESDPEIGKLRAALRGCAVRS
jgi:hypothetical protein